MRRGLGWVAGALGLAALWRLLRDRQAASGRALPAPLPPAADPAAELRAKLDQAREAPDDRDEFDAAEGQPVDAAEPPARSLDERRRSIHEKAQEALGEMQRPPGESVGE